MGESDLKTTNRNSLQSQWEAEALDHHLPGLSADKGRDCGLQGGALAPTPSLGLWNGWRPVPAAHRPTKAQERRTRTRKPLTCQHRPH